MRTDQVFIGFKDSTNVLYEFKPDVYILFAMYDIDEYEGQAFVLFEKDSDLYEVTGAHCSCNGLEGQWFPEKVTIKELEDRIEHGNTFYNKELEKYLKGGLK